MTELLEHLLEVAKPSVQGRVARVVGLNLEIDGLQLPIGASVRVHRGDALVLSTWIAARDGQPLIGEIWLAPGDYKLAATADKLAGSVSLTVGDHEGPPLRLELR